MSNLPGPGKAVLPGCQIRWYRKVVGARTATVLGRAAGFDAHQDPPRGLRRWLHVRSNGQLTRTSSVNGRTLFSS